MQDGKKIRTWSLLLAFEYHWQMLVQSNDSYQLLDILRKLQILAEKNATTE